ncbi:hypothetical protein [Thalassotalea sp. SU-HH00458]|uniref:hypothetical protein n=1 Tax=Thalassotalea sp. SU-HH00458 TaxID=3127657 RepID=UPI00310795BF
MFELTQLKSFNKSTSDSFHQQKNFIKKVLAGRISQCPQCKQNLTINLSHLDEPSTIRCAKKCTDIELDCS